MKKWPVICPLGSRVIITQGMNKDHDANDFIIGDLTLTERDNLRLSYGAQFVSPVPNAECVQKWDFGPMNNLGNGVDIEWQEDGYYWRLHFWHTVKELVKVGDKLTEGQVVGLMGNTGDCRPLPTVDNPFAGTHCHLRLSRYNKNEYGGNFNIVSLDPSDYFDVYNPYQGNDSSVTVDLEPVKWAWDKLGITTAFDKLVYLLKNIFN